MSLDKILEKFTTVEGHVSEVKKRFGVKSLSQFKGAYLFGSAESGKKNLKIFRDNGVEIAGFSDNDKRLWGKKIDGLKVIPPEELAKNITVIITSKYVASVSVQLASLGLKNVVPHYVLSNVWPDTFPNPIYDNATELIIKNKPKIVEAYNLLTDQESKTLFMNLLKFRLTLSPKDLPQQSVEQEYFPTAIWKLSDHETFIDVGAYKGDTLDTFLKLTSGKFKKYIGLEPDQNNYSDFLGAIPENLSEKIIAINAGAGSTSKTVRFLSLGGLDSAISDQGDTIVKIVRIDDVCEGERPSMVKMDVEGYEPEVINGMKRVMIRDEPKLAVCLYHRPEHLWEIPLLIASVNGGYHHNMIIRHHHEELFDTILYTFL